MKHLQHLESQHEVINPLINRHCFQSNMRAVNCAYYLGKWGLVCKQSSTLLHLLLSLWKFNKFLSASSKGYQKSCLINMAAHLPMPNYHCVDLCVTSF